MTFQTREVSEFLSRSRVFFLRKLLEEIIHQNKEVNQERRDKVQNTGTQHRGDRKRMLWTAAEHSSRTEGPGENEMHRLCVWSECLENHRKAFHVPTADVRTFRHTC